MNKAIFGAYLNAAQHNAYMILNHIKDLVTLKDKNNTAGADVEESRLDNINILQLKNAPEKIAYTLKLLYLHFPFLGMLVPENINSVENNYEKVARILKKALVRLNQERNQYSHYETQTLKTESHFVLASTQKDLDLDELRSTFLNWFNLDNPNKERAFARYPFMDGEARNFMGLHIAKNSLWKNSSEAGKDFSEKGLIYFLCLFLERKQAYLLLNSIQGFKGSKGNKFRAVREMYAHNCCKLPQPRLDSSDILLDMLNELNRCPKDLFQVLGETDQQRFMSAIDNASAVVKRQDDNGELLEYEKRIRHQDRFPYFALRYFDDTNAFPRLRFQLYIGKLLQKTYDKALQGETYQRQIAKEIYAFGKLSEFLGTQPTKHPLLKNMTVYEQHTIDTATGAVINNPNAPEIGQIVQFSPQYNFGTNKIMLKIGKETTVDSKALEYRRGEKGVVLKDKMKIKKIEPEEKEAILSTHELPNLFLYHYLYKQGHLTSTVESFIEKYIDTFRKFIKSVQTKQFLPLEKSAFKRRSISYKDRKEATIKKAPQTGREPYNDKNFEELKDRKTALQHRLDNSDFKGLYWSYLPDEIVNYLLNTQPTDYKTVVLAKIDELKDQTNELKQQFKRINKRKAFFEEEQEENPTNDHTATFSTGLRVGEIATWLAKDIIFLKPYQKDVKNYGKPNNDQYNRLQTLLALYPLYKDELPKFFEELHLIGGKSTENHPFLSQNLPNSLYDFYQNYIDAKLKWLIQLHTDIDGVKRKDKATQSIKTVKEGLNPTQIENLYSHLFGKISQVETNIESKKYDTLPIALPVGLFNAAILEGMQRKGIALSEKDNTLFALKNLLQNDTQEFYHYPRRYETTQEILQPFLTHSGSACKDLAEREKLMESLKNEINRLGKSTNEEKLILRRTLVNFRSRVLEKEQTIRFTQQQDRCLWLMCQELTNYRKEKTQEGIQLDFTNTSLQKLEELLDTNKEMKLQVYIYKTKQAIGIITDTLPIRRYGDLRRFAKNRQLPNLYDYFYDENQHQNGNLPTFSPQNLQDALEFLEKNRPSILQKALDLEEVIFSNYEVEFVAYKAANSTKTDPDHNIFIEYLFSKLPETTLTQIAGANTEAKKIFKLRNHILHNEVPPKEYIGNHLTQHLGKNPETPLQVTEFIIAHTIRIYEQLAAAV